MRYLNGWHPFQSIRFDLVKITIWQCLILQIWEQQKTASTKPKSNSITRHKFYIGLDLSLFAITMWCSREVLVLQHIPCCIFPKWALAKWLHIKFSIRCIILYDQCLINNLLQNRSKCVAVVHRIQFWRLWELFERLVNIKTWGL